MAKPKYQGKLKRPITPGIIELAQHGSFANWLGSNRVKREYLSRMNLLLENYQIDPSSPDCWFILALELANDHVPGFCIKRFHRNSGRPKKKLATSPAKKSGRPRKYFDNDYATLVNSVDARKKILEHKLNRKVTDKSTLTDLLKEMAVKKGRSTTRFVQEHLEHFQKRLSDGRKEIRKIDNK